MKRVNFNVVGLGLYAHLLGMEEQGFDDIAYDLFEQSALTIAAYEPTEAFLAMSSVGIANHIGELICVVGEASDANSVAIAERLAANKTLKILVHIGMKQPTSLQVVSVNNSDYFKNHGYAFGALTESQQGVVDDMSTSQMVEVVFNRAINHPDYAHFERMMVMWCITNSVMQAIKPNATPIPALAYDK